MQHLELIEAYAAGPQLLRDAVAGMSEAYLKTAPIPGKWTTLQVVAHLADFEPIHASRMKFVIAHERPLLVDGDEGAFAKSLEYADRQIENELAIIESARRQMARILRSLPATAFERPGVHTFRGLVTLRDLVQSAVDHIPHHVKFIREKRQCLGLFDPRTS
jgi:hypothetical protein